MFSPVNKAALADPVGLNDEVARHRKIAIDPLANAQIGMAALNNVAIAPDGNTSKALWRRKEVPIAHSLTERRIGDVVGG